MGTEYYITCTDCKVRRDLDKFYSATIYPVNTREEALAFQDKIKEDSFRAALLVSFMGDHMGHNCVFHDEHNDNYETYSHDSDEPADYRVDTDFWNASDAND